MELALVSKGQQGAVYTLEVYFLISSSISSEMTFFSLLILV